MRSDDVKKTTGRILANAGVLTGILFAFAFNQLFDAPKTLVGWAIVVVLGAEVKFWERHWIAYSVIYWACDMSQKDNFALIAVTTLAFAAITAAAVILPDAQYNTHRKNFFVAAQILTSIPVSCNNLLFHPFLGIIRFALFSSLVQFGKNKRQFTGLYILFSKSEALLPLIIWHVLVHCANEKVVFHPELIEDNEEREISPTEDV